MFFDLWKEDFINKMEEERKKRKEAMKLRKIARQKQKEENKRKEKKMEEMVKIEPRWVIINCILDEVFSTCVETPLPNYSYIFPILIFTEKNTKRTIRKRGNL